MTEYLPISRLRAHPANVREDLGDLHELAASIRSHGILQPVIVQPNPAEPGTWLILGGHRRTAAARLAGLSEIPVTVRAAAGPKAIEIMLVENCQRSDLGPMEKAEAMGKLRRRGMTGADISRAIGLHPSTVSYYLALLDLDDASQERVRNGDVAADTAIKAVRKTRQRPNRGGQPKASLPAGHFSYRHPLAGAARLRCQLAGHEGVKYGRDSMNAHSKVACGQCWEHVIRADERGEQQAADEPSPAGAREERLRVIAGLSMLDGPTPDDMQVTAGEAAKRLGVTKRTVERYKAELAKAGAAC
jgi:ParB family chromosome partitioning protein